ncbi:thrombospondin type 3 repeat-containing protein [Porticoccaceae bacterium]|nr:thrombospondin type 3 repeat-containing protein [Porticoccaceae bacterium]
MTKLISLVLSSLTVSFSIGATGASNEVFEAIPILLPDLRPKYELLCGNQTSAQTLDLADLNGDGRKDIVVGLWCAIPPGTVTHEPVVGGLLAFTQNADGSFVDRTNALFGSELPSIEKPFENVVYDFNGDGYDDIFMTQSREDGRADPWDARDSIENAIVMSNGDGTYSILRDGCNDPCGTGYNSHAMDNEVGGIDIVTQSIGAGAVQVWRYTNEWEYISNLDNSGGLVFFKKTDPELATLVYSSASRVDGVPAVNLYTRINPNDAWTKVDTLSMQADTTITTTWTAWNGDAGPIDIRVLDGQYYLGGSYEYGCEFTTQAYTDLNLVYLQTSYMLDSYYDGMDIVEGRDMKWIYKLFGFSAKDGNLTSLPIILQAPDALTDKPYRIHCEDVNQDGLDDIVVATWGDETHPHVYINTGGNNFSLVREELWPPITDALKSAQQKYADVNGDGIFDIVSFPFTGVNNTSSDVVIYEILHGKNHFQANDTYDADSDGVINATDDDDDDDGVLDESDAFPLDSAESLDTDGDGVGDNADVFDNDPSETTDSDSDGVGDNGDAFPLDASESLDTDLDGTGNNADTDDDGDTVLDRDDAFPLDSTESVDTDSNGIGNNTDADDDGDGAEDAADAFPLDSTETVDTDLDGIGNNADTDDDGDGVEDAADAFPLDSTETVDTDLDDIGNNADTDDDGDGVEDAADAFPLDSTETVDTDLDGIGNNADTDDDGDGVNDDVDRFPLDPLESSDLDDDGVGNNSDIDADNDGVANLLELSLFDNGVIDYNWGNGWLGYEQYDSEEDGRYCKGPEAWGFGECVGLSWQTVEDDVNGTVLEVQQLPYEGQGGASIFITEKNGDSSSADLTRFDNGFIKFDIKVIEGQAEQVFFAGLYGRPVGDGRSTGWIEFQSAEIGSWITMALPLVDLMSPDAEYPFSGDLEEIYWPFMFDHWGGLNETLRYRLDNISWVSHYKGLDSAGQLQDVFPLDATESLDTDGDEIGNNADTDDDNDGISDLREIADGTNPLDAASLDTDRDGIADSTDIDDDGDGVVDSQDLFPLDGSETIDSDSDGVGDNADTDDDGDGTLDQADAFPLDPSETLDTDSDGIGNNSDNDDDGDGVLDINDAFPVDNSETVDSDGDGKGNNADNDDDGDGLSDQYDRFPLDPTEWLDTDMDGVGDNADAFPSNALFSTDKDLDGMPDAWEIRYGLDPNDPSDASSDQDNDGVSAYDEFLAGTIPAGSLDIDGNGQYDALTDGLLLLRGMFLLSGDALISGAVASEAVYKTSDEVASRIDMLGDLVDIDGNGSVDALTDGLVILRYLFNLRGDVLINDVIASDATVKTAEDVEAKIEQLIPSL